MKKFAYFYMMLLGMIFLMGSQSAKAQDELDEFTKDIIHMQEVNGTGESFNSLYSDILAQLSDIFPNLEAKDWRHMRETVFNPMVLELQLRMVPILKKYYTHKEVKEIIAFYESPAGRKLTQNSTRINHETSSMSQAWAEGLMENIQIYLSTME